MNGGRGCVCVCVCVCGVCWGSNLAQKISTIISEPKFEPPPPPFPGSAPASGVNH